MTAPPQDAPASPPDEARTAPSPSSRPTFGGILFDGDEARRGAAPEEPEYFHDLNLDLIVEAITAGRDEYRLKPFFHASPLGLPAINYRQEIMRDLEKPALFEALKAFSAQMRTAKGRLAAIEKLSFPREKTRWFLDAAVIYGDAVEKLRSELRAGAPRSRGLLAFLGYLEEYAGSAAFQGLRDEARKLADDLSAIHYGLLIQGSSITVRDFRGEADYSAAIEEAFARFRRGAAKDYRVKLPTLSGLNHVEAQILDRVARLNPEVFRALDAFCANHQGFCESVLVEFDREAQFYLAYLEYAARFKAAGLDFCYPQVSDASKSVFSRAGYDLALAEKLIREKSPVVRNDFALDGPERILVVTGPNQGGKTTFARTFGQVHHLAGLGCPVAGAEARLFRFDRIFTHFEREEDVATLRGKLQDDLVRMHRILAEAGPSSIVIVNEIFSSTSLQDAVFLGRKIVESLGRLDLLAVCVTFLDELASLDEKTVSMVATVAPENPALRTYRLERRPADGLSYALAIAEKYRLTYDRLKERLRHVPPPDVP